MTAPRPARSASLQFGLPIPGERPLRAPVVEAQIHGQHVRFVVDTGAAAPTLASWIVTAAGLSTTTARTRVDDATGHGLRGATVEHPTISLDGWGAVPDRPATVVEMPPFFAANHIAGLLSPQWLAAADEVVVLDLRAGRMYPVPAARAGSALGTGDALAPYWVRGCSNLVGGIENVDFVVPVIFEGRAVGAMAIDTGADRSAILSGSEPARSLSDRAVGDGGVMGIAGVASRVQRTAATRIQVGQHVATLDFDVTDARAQQACPYDGRIGMDVLQRCTLALGPTTFLGRCDTE